MFKPLLSDKKVQRDQSWNENLSIAWATYRPVITQRPHDELEIFEWDEVCFLIDASASAQQSGVNFLIGIAESGSTMVGEVPEGSLLAAVRRQSKIENVIAYLARNPPEKRALLLWVGVACIDWWLVETSTACTSWWHDRQLEFPACAEAERSGVNGRAVRDLRSRLKESTGGILYDFWDGKSISPSCV